MTTRLKEVDAVMVGMGWTGSIMARELTKAGLTVVGLERGEDITPREHFALPNVRDELKYSQRLELIQDPALETVTFRHRPSESALPMRRMGSFLPGTTVGGSANHWGGLTWRYHPTDHLTRSHIVNRYGAKAIPEDMTIQDWAMTYDELEPYYDKFDKLCGVSGKAGNLRGQKIAGGNVFEGPRQNEYPNPPLKMTESALVFEKAAKELGYNPFPQPISNSSRAYTNSEGLTLGECQYCGHCDRNGCEANQVPLARSRDPQQTAQQDGCRQGKPLREIGDGSSKLRKTCCSLPELPSIGGRLSSNEVSSCTCETRNWCSSSFSVSSIT